MTEFGKNIFLRIYRIDYGQSMKTGEKKCTCWNMSFGKIRAVKGKTKSVFLILKQRKVACSLFLFCSKD